MLLDADHTREGTVKLNELKFLEFLDGFSPPCQIRIEEKIAKPDLILLGASRVFTPGLVGHDERIKTQDEVLQR